MNPITAKDYQIFFENDTYDAFINYLEDTNFSSLFILVDSNTKNKCLPIFLSKIPSKYDVNIITIPAGEDFKNLTTCNTVWQELTRLKADRKSVLINIGGGMLTDLGGFVAATYKRGIRFIHVSTSLLGMVDASVGGKTGVDFNGLKNQIGVFANPELVLIDTNYLKTLAKRELISGMAEVIKYGLTYDKALWNDIKKTIALPNKNLSQWIYKSVSIKNEIVLKDPKENHLRKILNYGHTIGHAIETHFLQDENKNILAHGEAIAIGLICETYISTKLFGFPKQDLAHLKSHIISLFDTVYFDESDYSSFLELMKHDKKNVNGNVRFVLLEKIGICKIDCEVSESLIIEALNFYQA